MNLGLNDSSVVGLAKQTSDERFAFDSYRRFVQMYGRIVLGVPGEQLDGPLEALKERTGASDAELSAGDLQGLVEELKAVVEKATGRPFPQAPLDQLRGAVEAVFASWNGARAVAYRQREHIPNDLGTAVNVQAMVFGNRDDNSGTGVGFTRDPATGAKGAYGDFLVNAQGEDVVAGIRNTEPLSALETRFPSIYSELMDIFARLEAHYRDMCDTEFTIEQGKLWMLQTRVGKRTGRAALRMAVDMVDDPAIHLTHAEALGRVTPEHIEAVLHPQFADHSAPVLAKGLAASPGAAVGAACFTADDAAAAAARGERVILVRSETSPEDVHGMLAAEGILTARGGLVSHAAVVARGWGKPAVVGADALRISAADKSFRVGDTVVREGELISIDGSEGTVVLGAVKLTAAEAPPELTKLLSWADEIREGRLGVRANADTGADAANARRLGAEGIGLCRTEHMFFGDDRLPIMRRMILASSEEEETAALEELRAAQKADFLGILEAMDGLPVIVRGLDPPLHEFLPDVESLLVKQAKEGLTSEEEKLLEAAKAWREANPMIGVRGVRLGVLKPGLYAMQVRALMEAAYERAAAGGHPVVEIMIPLTISREEMALARSWAVQALKEAAEANASRAGSADADRGRHRHDDRDAAGRPAGRRDRGGGRLLLLRDERPHPDDLRLQPRRRRGQDDGRLPEPGPAQREPLRERRHRRCRRTRPYGRRAGPGGAPWHQDRRLWRARRRPRLDPLLREGRSRLRELLSVPRPHRAGSPRPRRCSRWTPRKRLQPPCKAVAADNPARLTDAPLGEPRYRPGDGDSRRGRGGGPRRHRHPRSHRRVHAAQTGRAPLRRPVPVPCGEDAVVLGQRRGRPLLLLRLPGLR